MRLDGFDLSVALIASYDDVDCNSFDEVDVDYLNSVSDLNREVDGSSSVNFEGAVISSVYSLLLFYLVPHPCAYRIISNQARYGTVFQPKYVSLHGATSETNICIYLVFSFL